MVAVAPGVYETQRRFVLTYLDRLCGFRPSPVSKSVTMTDWISSSNIAIVGGGRKCKVLLELLLSQDTAHKTPAIKGVADKNIQAVGIRYAEAHGIFTTTDYRELFSLKDIDLVVELTNDDSLREILQSAKPPWVRLVDHHEARSIIDYFKITAKKNEMLEKVRRVSVEPEIFEGLFEAFYDFVLGLNDERDAYFGAIRQKLVANERTMAQIIEGSTIPTFVIDRDHTVTHWNHAMEQLTGYSAREIVGTNKQWAPFYEKERSSMADVIVDQIDELEIRKLYGTKWRKSVLIEGAYEAEMLFPNLGENGKWCWFTAAPLKTPDGEVVGAIETIWDKTEDRKVEKERERHTRELAAYCSIYATLSGTLSLEGRIKEAIQEVANIFLIDGICIYTLKIDGQFHLQYNYGHSENFCYRCKVAGDESMILRVAKSGKVAVFQDVADSGEGEMTLLKQESLRSLVYIPILDKEKKAFGVIRAASKNTRHFGPDEARALELIGNRIGVAIENSELQKEVKRKAGFQEKLIGSSNDGIIATDRDWKVVIFNSAAEEIFGLSASEAIGKMDAREFYPPTITQEFDALMADGGKGWNLPWRETMIIARNGDHIPVRFSGTILHEKNRMMGIVAFINDLREIKRLEKELVNAERLAAIGQTVAGMAHCIKNILHGLKGGSYLVNIGINKDQTEKLKTGWQMVQRNIGRTSDLVQDLLSYSKEREPEFKPCFPNEIADDVCELMTEVAGENNVALQKKFSQSIGEVVMDPRTIHRCLLNLVSNAIDACRYDDSANKTHCVTVSTALESDNFIRFDVSDNGSGMTDEVKEKIFASFFSTKGSQGTGLGLLVSSKLIEEHGGTIAVTSKLGEGTTFTVRLPIESEV